MLHIKIPGYGNLRLEYLILDFNGTLACDGSLIPGVEERLKELAENLQLRVVTADTFGTVQAQMASLPCEVVVLDKENAKEGEDHLKLALLQELGPARCIFIGNGRNDRLAVKAAAIGIAVCDSECAAPATLYNADIAAPGIIAALDILLNSKRLIATLRC